ncbi:hypothetical protein ACVBEJ_13235 [Porticoccus sp. GXU_MW_L64]
MDFKSTMAIINSTCVSAALLFLTACGSGGSGPTPTAQNVVGATSQQQCESAADRDAPACFVISGNQARMYGVLGSASPNTVNTLVRTHPSVTEIVMVDVPGSMDDDQNLRAARALRTANLNTRIEANGSIASGGVDFFIAGVQRTIINGATIGVHSWAEGNTEGSSLPRNDPRHNVYIDYYRDMGLADPSGFYFFTLNAAPSSGIHNMTPAEISQWQLATPVAQQVTSSSTTVKVSPGNKLGEHRVSVSQDNSIFVEGDSADTLFQPGTGVSYIDGGPGRDTVRFSGPYAHYTIDRSGGEITVIDSDYSRNGVVVLKNMERLIFTDRQLPLTEGK